MTPWINRLTLGLSVGLAGVVLSLTPIGFELERSFGLRWLFQLRGAGATPTEAVVVAADRESAAALGVPEKPRDWPRSLHARLIEALARAGASVIAVDFTFDTASADRNEDQALANAMRAARNVVVVASLRGDVASGADGPQPATERPSIETLVSPISVVADAALAYAPFPLPKAARVDAYWSFKDGAGDHPTLPAVALQIHALSAYDDLLALWRKAGIAPPPDVPVDRDALVASGRLPEVMLRLREALSGDPQSARRMAEVLGQASREGMAADKVRPVGALLGLYAGSESQFLNFFGPPRTIRTIPYHRVLAASTSAAEAGAQVAAAGEFAGKAVFVGFSAAVPAEQDRVRDDYRTVFSRSDGLDLSGVEIAATAFVNLLHQRPVRPLGFPWHVVAVFGWGLLAGVAGRNLRPALAAFLGVSASGAYLASAACWFDVESVWMPLVIPLVCQTPVALFAGVWLRYRHARRQRELIKRIFGYFLPRPVVDQLAKSVGPVTAANQLVFGVCLATDGERYTTLAETMDPTRLSLFMNEYFAMLFAPVERHGGVVSDVVGDAMLATWAASSSEESLRRGACHAALEIAEAVRQFNDSGIWPSLPTRIGLHAGQMLLGSIGAGQHYEYRAVGDIVNTATRIEGLGKYLGARLLVSEAALEGLEELLARPLGAFLLVGKSNPVRIFELIGRKTDAGGDRHWLCERFAAALDAYAGQRWREAADLLAAVLERFPQDGPARFYLARCEAYAVNPPSGPWEPTVRVEGK